MSDVITENEWAFNLDLIIFTEFKKKMSVKFQETYPNMLVTTEQEQDGDAVFPAILFQELGLSEAGHTLDGTTINAIRPTYQITITHSGNQNELKQLVAHAALIMKSKGFQLSNINYMDSNITKTGVFRATRIIGANDTI